ncbi:hypothetical protein TRFO_22699 [Tritrichomonas foetus]|uniref:Nucleoplasmin-like domain-containing protein n=1 Tax=Tritrichomonas foetus TaxID=1144522 RepID=A0A1J4KFR9_9EUKA|nr:hypothetical protein TRFO_22699 [Tritrichomonas foetus]|eukprot:OHT08628.1 hypothetical protein TRFO_22699 [Tritrichomonas foetus]
MSDTAFECVIQPGETQTIDFKEFETLVISYAELTQEKLPDELKGKEISIIASYTDVSLDDNGKEVTENITKPILEATLEEGADLTIDLVFESEMNLTLKVEGPTPLKIIGEFAVSGEEEEEEEEAKEENEKEEANEEEE